MWKNIKKEAIKIPNQDNKQKQDQNASRKKKKKKNDGSIKEKKSWINKKKQN